jgi:hypothetical protein
MPGALTYISVARDGTIWATSANEKVWSWESGDWKLLPGLLKKVSVEGHGAALGIYSEGEVYFKYPTF